VRRARQAVGDDFLIMFRLSMADLVEEGSSGEEIVAQAQAIEQAGADILNSGIGWHEARVPTIAHAVPPAAFVWATARVKKAVRIPVAACNRINKPELAEAILAQGEADLVSMARPFLADPHFVAKAKAGKPESINICIACNQACLDAIFSGQPCSCLVNPRACRESELAPKPARKAKAIAVVGSGPAGLACAAEAASRGHRVTLFEAKRELGGQFRLASRVPGKQEFAETARYFAGEFTRHGGTIRTGTQANASDLAGFDAVVLATGAKARMPAIPGIGSPIVASYEEILDGSRIAGERVAIIGAGGIGFNVAEFLCRDGSEPFSEIWGIDPGFAGRGALKPAMPLSAKRKITLLQRKAAKPGGSLGKTTGWIHRALLQQAGVKMLGGVTYRKIDSQGLHITIGAEELLIEADTVIICAGQEPERSLLGELSGPEIHVIGGAEKAEELDARRAIEQGVLLAQAL
jgi:2,4-dienoyl-CoA reductase (NADPH2)